MDRNRRRTGQALVECALVLPLLVTLSLAVLQIVLYAHARAVLISAVQEGARLAAEDGRTVDQGYRRAQDLIGAGLGDSVAPVSIEATVDGDVVILSADTRLRGIMPMALVDDFPVHAEAAVARERFRPGGGGG